MIARACAYVRLHFSGRPTKADDSSTLHPSSHQARQNNRTEQQMSPLRTPSHSNETPVGAVGVGVVEDGLYTDMAKSPPHVWLESPPHGSVQSVEAP